MKISFFLIAAVVCACVSAKENLHLETTKNGDEDIVTLTNDEGKVVSTFDVSPENKYQLEIPADENVCIVSRLPENGNGPEECYKRVVLPEDLDHDLELKECEGRQIFLLEPVEPEECEEASRISSRGSRLCIWVYQDQCYCAETERYCERKGWFFGWHTCAKYGTRCKRYDTRQVKVEKC